MGRGRGFTLIELMVVVALSAALMAIAIPISQGISGSNQRSQCAFNLHTLGQSLLALRDDYRAFPRDRAEAEPGIGSITSYGYPGIVGLYSLYYLTEYTGDYISQRAFVGAGTATFALGSTSVTGVGTAWLTSQEVIPGDLVHLDSDGATWYEIAAVTGDTALTLKVPHALGGSGAYSFRKMTPLAQQAWFAGGNYLRKLSVLHCPSNETVKIPSEVVNPPLLGPNPGEAGYNNYDLYYRRDWFDTPPYPNPPADKRNLVESAYPPADTLITFCPYHRRSQDFVIGHPTQHDEDLVLFADGAVLRLPSYPYDPGNFGSNDNPAKWFSVKRAEAGQ